METLAPPSAPPFACTHSPGLPELLAELDCSLALSTYQAGKVILLGTGPRGLVQLPRTFDKPMGMIADATRMAVATRDEVVLLRNAPALAQNHPQRPGTYDALYVPTTTYYAGELDLHDMAWGGPEAPLRARRSGPSTRGSRAWRTSGRATTSSPSGSRPS